MAVDPGDYRHFESLLCKIERLPTASRTQAVAALTRWVVWGEAATAGEEPVPADPEMTQADDVVLG